MNSFVELIKMPGIHFLCGRCEKDVASHRFDLKCSEPVTNDDQQNISNSANIEVPFEGKDDNIPHVPTTPGNFETPCNKEC